MQIFWLMLVIFLMPLNLLLEAWHWKFSVSGIKKVHQYSALRMVLGSMIPAMITPLKIGEWPGRASFFPVQLRGEVTTAAIFAGIVKTISLSLWGTLALLVIALKAKHPTHVLLSESGITLLILLLTAFFASNKLFKWLLSSKYLKRFTRGHTPFQWLNMHYRITSLSIASLRTFVFYTQFGLMILFFIPDIDFWEIAIYIPVYFMILTFLPAFSLSDPALRGSVAIVLFTGLTHNVPLIGIAGVMLWFINNLLPMISGSVIWFRKAGSSYQVVRKRNSY